MPEITANPEHSASYKDFTVYARFVTLANGYLLLVTDQAEYGIGTIALSTPPSGITKQAISSPFNLFGLKHSLLANLLGKTASKHLKKPVMTMILIKNSIIKPKIVTQITTQAVNQAVTALLKTKHE